MRVGFVTLSSLALCAAAAGAAIAHEAIDVIGDFALAHDSYDNIAHGSRELLSGIALVLAVLLAARGLRSCCELARIHRNRVQRVTLGLPEMLGYLAAAVSVGCALVPAMEWLDGRADGVAVLQLSEAFGGSLALGLGTTIICASLISILVFAIARWLIAHRDTIAAIIETLLRRADDAVRPLSCILGRQRLTFQNRTAHTLRLSKRGPPVSLPA
ncbi:MAG TPA: hypothetical protein VGI19_01945 [Candidatus Cybelea sp.]